MLKNPALKTYARMQERMQELQKLCKNEWFETTAELFYTNLNTFYFNIWK